MTHLDRSTGCNLIGNIAGAGFRKTNISLHHASHKPCLWQECLLCVTEAHTKRSLAACRDELRQPLLGNGHYDEEVAVTEPKVMPPPSSSADSDDEEELREPGWWEQVRHMWSSPLMATACCIFLCYILKVLQQVFPLNMPLNGHCIAPPLRCLLVSLCRYTVWRCYANHFGGIGRAAGMHRVCLHSDFYACCEIISSQRRKCPQSRGLFPV